MPDPKNHKQVILEVYKVKTEVFKGEQMWQSCIKAMKWTTYFKPSLTKQGAINAANNFVRAHNLVVNNRKQVTRYQFNVKEAS